MPTNDPPFIRLVRSRSRNICADLDSRFSISGTAVKPFPTDKGAARFVRKKLAAGVLEPASRAEFEESEEIRSRVVEMGDAGHQESQIRDQMSKRSKSKEVESDEDEADDDDDLDDEVEDEGDDDESDEDEVEDEPKAPVKKAPAKKKASAKKAPAKKK